MNTELRPLAEITREAIEILYRELGAVDTNRFLNQFSLGQGDITLEDAIPQIKAEREEHP
ncbi:MAG: hypothetical protein AB1646_06115 [Thermodesulfobacteriota bacterium]